MPGRFYLDFCFGGSANFDSVRTLWAVSNFEGYSVTFVKLVERDANKLIGVEEEIFGLAFALYKPEPFVCEPGDCSFLHIFCYKKSG